MTAIASIVEGGRVYMGGDACASVDGSIGLSDEPKIVKKGRFLFGTCGMGRLGSVIRYCFAPPRRPNKLDADTYINTVFLTKLKECLRENGCLSLTNGVESMDGMILVGYQGDVWSIDGEFCAYRLVHKYVAIGSGGNICMGALHATQGQDPKERIEKALDAAASFIEGVRPPFTIEVL